LRGAKPEKDAAPESARTDPSATGVVPATEDGNAGLVIHGLVQSREIDPRRWSVRGTSLRYAAVPVVHRSEVDSRGRFELVDLDDVDYRVELVVEGDPPFVLARSDYVRPGGDELVLEIDALQLRKLAEVSHATQ
jgi:hypothetical protein